MGERVRSAIEVMMEVMIRGDDRGDRERSDVTETKLDRAFLPLLRLLPHLRILLTTRIGCGC